ncbi:hypothetical protein [Paenibacillus sacheonensis]|uniref:Aminoglycoside phosphotransferase domain-containing protein n=1 Tax=Paenibacillus sacheonensis TaxID=742054 RepID=A0A7X5BZJ0_9BACL|nr:hypothetical protein [Paenibacillus sacheonensis]MBM7564263.1 hypothetical protein [Paenibacillus sacheonensis]NBC67414.1 hypothetical protein [Paenibacillus sacheonensis]
MRATLLLDALTELLEDDSDKLLAGDILGTANSKEIADAIGAFCVRRLDSPVKKCLYAGFSVGASFGLALEDGRQVFMKIHKLTGPETITANTALSLAASSTVQKHLAESGFPCPEVLLMPEAFGSGIVTVDAYAAPGELQDAHKPEIRKAMAETLAELIARTRPFRSLPGLIPGSFCASGTLFPVPHNALFDFTKEYEGSEWIDAIAGSAKAEVQANRSPGNLALGHVDWSVKHFRFENGKAVMIYDWDSLKLEDELHLVGLAAATFPTTWDIPVLLTPSREESGLFVREYEAARGKPFTSRELATISAAATYVMSYVARCELAINPNNERYEGSFRQALQAMNGDRYIVW